jgi:hypothetical protein
VVGSGVLLVDVEAAELGLEAVASALAAGEAGGEDHAVVGEGGFGGAELLDGIAEGCDDAGPGDAGVCGDAECEREQSSSQLRISTSEPGHPSWRVRRKWVKSACQHSLGRSAWKRM